MNAPPPRIVIERVAPEIDAGRHPIKRTVGESVVVSADVFAEGHDRVVAILRSRRQSDEEWQEVPMRQLPNHRWEAAFTVEYDDEGRGAVRYALAALKNVGAQAVDALVAERHADGPYGSLGDLAARLDGRVLNKRLLESLAAAIGRNADGE